MKTKKYYQTPASAVIKVKVQLLQDSDPNSTETGGGESREQRSDWGED